MQKNIILSLLFGCSTLWGQEVGINTDSPKATLEIKGNTIIADATSDGLIIPRVSSLNTNTPKEIGLLVFLEKENNDAKKENRGFYWWDGSSWRPFLSSVQTSINRTITYVQTKKKFDEGRNFTRHTDTSIAENTRNITFNPTSLRTYDASLFGFSNKGELTINKAGYYNITASVYLFKGAGAIGAARDMFNMSVLINGSKTSAKNSNAELSTIQTFPFGINRGIALISTGAIKLDSGDRISLQVVREHRGTSGVGSATTTNIMINQNADSSITLQYLGDF